MSRRLRTICASRVSVLGFRNNDGGAYPVIITAGRNNGACATQTRRVSAGTTFPYLPVSATDLSGYIMTTINSRGSGQIYSYDSLKGGSVTTTTPVTVWRNACGL